ncbi:MAG: hypothetical protein E7543_07275 [Ruminococcaceae bacterium]|nr:hypothetical protein [Oscillospiraceae bacterium]
MNRKFLLTLAALIMVLQCAFCAGFAASAEEDTLTVESAKVAYAAKKTALKITKQPSSVAVNKGKKAKVKVTAKGDGLTYSWYYKNKGDKKYTLAKDVKSATYSVTMKSKVNGRKVYCVVKDKYGKKVKSEVATLTMSTPLKITKQPASVAAAGGKAAKVKVTAKGDGLKYTWYFKNKNATKFTKSDIKTSTYSVTMNSTVRGRQVYCVIKDKYGKKVQTDTVTLFMGKILKITKQPVSTGAEKGKTAEVSIKAKGEGLTYSWYYKNKSASSYTRATAFKKSSYSVTMSSKFDGRKVYCIVKDKYGNEVKSATVTLRMGVVAKITKQPSSVTVHKGEKAKVKVSAKGDGLTYVWYYKDKNKSSFSKVKTVKGSTYTTEMNNKSDGRQVYCVIKDEYGNKVTSKTVTLSSGHKLGSWKVYRKATVQTEGIERRTCSKCSYYKDRSIPKLKAVYYITVNTGSGSYKVGVPADGSYNLEKPVKDGYAFEKFTDSKGNTFASKGTVKKNITVYVQWKLVGTGSLQQLVKRANAGVDKICITADIVVSEPIFISYKTKIYSDSNYSIRRAADYAGDIFVVGTDKDGVSATSLHRKAALTLGGGKGTLTVDGNRNELKTTVKGSAVFVCESAALNLYDGIKIINNKKIGNERVFKFTDYISTGSTDRAGGAAILNINGTVNMYGGLIDNNLVATEHTVQKNADGTETMLELNGCGGAIYNRGNFNMYGGTVSNSEGLRGGAFYNDRVAYLVSGSIIGNISHYYGAGVASSSSSNADLFIGSEGDGKTMLFKNNHSHRAGGALYSNTSSPIIIYGNTEFVNNSSSTSGGVIYTAGPLTVSDTVFDSNSCVYSGGAIYHHYTKAEFERRELTLRNCKFINNTANLGGALILSASDSVAETDMGTRGDISDCTFEGNKAVIYEGSGGNGGAIYITRKSDAVISDCTFSGNSSDNNAGALAVHSSSTVDMDDCKFTGNSAATGGAMYASSNAAVDMKNVSFESNSTRLSANGGNGNGGALYMYEADISFDNVDFRNNSAANHAGAVYLGASPVTFDSTCEFVSNSAVNHGGAIYMTYKTVDNVKHGSVLNATDVKFENNSAVAGGAVSIRSACKANITGGKLSGNSASGTEIDGFGGGAVYVGFGTLSLTDTLLSDNTSAGHGGAVNSVGSSVDVSGVTLKNNTAASGGAINAISSSVLTVKGSEFTGNESSYVNSDYNSDLGGGAINISKGTLTVDGTVFDGNKSNYYGGTIAAAKTTVSVGGNTVVKNSSGATGAALQFRYNSTVTLKDVELTDNTSSSNGNVYVNSSTLDMINVTAEGNSAANGGILYVSGAATQVNIEACSLNGNSAKSGGTMYVADATVNINGGEQKGNTANLGGAVYTKQGTINVKGTSFTQNSAVKTSGGSNGHGGAVYLSAANLYADESTYFLQNSAENHAGAVYLTYIKNTVTNPEDNSTETVTLNALLEADGTTFSGNSAMAGGAVSIRTGCEAKLNGVMLTGNSAEGYADENDGDGDGGGAVYVGYGKLTLDGVTATGNTASDFGGVIDAVSAEVSINGGSFSENKTNSGGVIYSMSKSDVTITDAVMSRNESLYVQDPEAYDSNIGGAAVHHRGGTLTVSGCTFDGNKTGYYGGAVLASDAQVTMNEETVVKNSEGSTGAALYFKGTVTADLTGIEIKDNTAKGNGVVYINYGTLNLTDVTATGNKAYQGGVIYGSNAKAKINVTDSTITGNDATNGGVVFFEKATASIKNSVLTGNTAKNGGVAYSKEGVFKLENSTINTNSATNGGVVNTYKGTADIRNITLENNSAASNGGAAYFNQSEVTLSNVKFRNNTAGLNGGAADVVGASVTADEACEFTGNSAVNHGGAVYVVYTKDEGMTENANGNFIATGGTFSKNTALGGGAVSIRSGCEATFDGTVFTENSVEGYTDESNDGNAEGGGAVYVGYGKATLNNVTATLNTASDFGGVLDAAGATVSISGGSYTGNSAGSGGVIYALANSKLTVSGAQISGNESDFVQISGEVNSNIGGGAVFLKNSTATLSGVTLAENKTDYYGGALHSVKSTVKIDGQSIIRNNSGITGGALYFRDGSSATLENITVENNTGTNGSVYQIGGTLTVTGITAKGNTAESGAAILTSTGTVGEIKNSLFAENSAVYGGALNLSSATVTVSDSVFEKNSSIIGGAAYNNGGQLTLSGVTFSENKAAKDANGKNGNGGALTTSAGTVTLTGENEFIGNIAENHGGAIYVTYKTSGEGENKVNIPGVVNATDGLFEGNTALAGGAISLRTSCEVYLTDTVIKKNRATSSAAGEGGGAIYANDNTLELSGVTLEENTSGYYGGAITASNAQVTVKDDSVINNNKGTTGAALDFRGNGTYTLDGVSVTNNIAQADGSGVIYITNTATLDITSLTATGNKNNNGGVIYSSSSSNVNLSDSVLSGNTAKNLGGAIDFRSSGKLVIDNTTLESNTAKKGGAINVSTDKGTVTVTSGTIKNNTATEKGGAVFSDKKGKIMISDNTVLEGNSAPTGGAVYLDTGAVMETENTVFLSNSATGDVGGAIVVADSSDEGTNATGLTVSGTTFKNNVAYKKGGAISTDEASPKLIINAYDCSFEGNTVTTEGAGAVEIRNGNCTVAEGPEKVDIVFTDCTFTGNESVKSTGGAVEIRSSSCAKFDGITATGNKAKANGGAIYVTSNYSRVYITGDVNASGNAGNGGKDSYFIYLYNSNYGNPPRIYTTYGEDAPWYTTALIGGNRTSITFNMVTLP